MSFNPGNMMAALALALAMTAIQPAMAEDPAEEPVPVTLANVKSFEVSNFTGIFPTGYPVSPEIVEYTRVELEESDVLPYDSPAQAVLQMECAGINCSTVVARVTLGHEGPLLWHAKARNHWGFESYRRNGKKVARDIVRQLEHAYQTTAASHPVRIDVP